MAATLADIERLGEAKMDAGPRAYISVAAGQGQTMRENIEAFKRYRFRPRILVDVEAVNTSTTVLGRTISFPVGVSPSALHKLISPAGEADTAQAAQEAGAVMILSSFSTVSLEDVRASAPDCILWQQLYVFQDRSYTESLVKRAADQGYAAIVLTADSPIIGDNVERVDRLIFKNRLPEGITYANLEAASKNSTSSTYTDYNEYSPGMHPQKAVTFKDLEWLCRLSDLPVVVKGVLTAEAALAAHRHGAAAVMVSNHGGRQLDGTPATMDVLPEIVAAVGHCMEIYLDGGVRCGADVAKALSLGARAVFVGRPVPWGLAYDGKQGVAKVLGILKEELERTLRLLGCPDVRDLSQDFVVHEEHYLRPPCCTVSRKKTSTNGF